MGKVVRPSFFESLENRTLFSTPQAPFTGSPIAVPGTIQAENYDIGGEGVAYHDTTPANLGGSYRKDAVDIRAAGTGHVVGYIQAGEWLEYTINVATAGTYRIDASVGTDYNGGAFHISIDGTDKTGEMTIKNTGGWDTYTTASKSGVALAGGTHVLRITFDTAGKKDRTSAISIISSSPIRPAPARARQASAPSRSHGNPWPPIHRIAKRRRASSTTASCTSSADS